MIWVAIALAVAGVLLSAFFAGIETGFYRASRLRLVLDALGGDSVARSLLALSNHPALFVATTLVGTNLANYLVSRATVLGVDVLWPGNSHLAEILVTFLLAPWVLVYGELLPKNLFLQAPNRLLRQGGPWFLVFVVLFFPIAGLLWALSRLLESVVRSSAEPVRLVLAQRELRRVLEEGHEAGLLHPAQRGLAQGILAIARQPIRLFLTPLADVPRARSNMSKQEVLDLAELSHAALIPVQRADARGGLVGYVRVIDLKRSDSAELWPQRPLLELREDTTHLTALMRMESADEGLARVVDAQGVTLGIVTLEQLRAPLF